MQEIHYKDKIKHFVISFVLAFVFFWLTQNVVLTLAVIVFLGVLKEVYDQAKKKNTKRESLADMLVNVVGIVVGILTSQYIF